MVILTHIDLNMMRMSEAPKHCPECGYFVMEEKDVDLPRHGTVTQGTCPNCYTVKIYFL